MTHEIKIEKTIKVTDEDIVGILCGVENAIGYWGGSLDYNDDDYERCRGYVKKDENEICYEDVLAELLKRNLLYVYDSEDDVKRVLSFAQFLKGIKLWALEYDRYNAVQTDGTLDCGEIDADMVDIIIQLALFEDIIYG